MLGSTRVGNHAVETPLGSNDSVQRAGNRVLVSHIAVLKLELAREALKKGLERLSGL